MPPLLPLLLAGAAQAAPVPPLSATLDWSPRGSHLRVEGGPGEHLSDDGPATVTVSWDRQTVIMETQGAPLSAEGVVLPPLEGTVSLTVAAISCEDDGTRCVPIETLFSVSLDARRGRARRLSPRPSPAPTAEPTETPPAPTHAPTTDAAFDTARLSDRLVLLDFTAVWCPPCNLLSAELLDDPADHDELASFVVAKVDVDRQESWPLKDRYAVGGYPTLLAVRPDGTEVDRLVGYPGEAQVKAWLTSLTRLPALGDLPALDALAPSDLADVAVRLERAGRHDDAAAALAAARAGGDPADLAAVVVEADTTAALRLLAAAEQPQSWLGDVAALAQEDTAVATALLARIPDWLAGAAPTDKADLLALRGALDTAQGPRWFAQAAATLWLGLSGEPGRDRGHWVGLASLYERAGDASGALAVLDSAVEHYPNEFTFHHARARTLLRATRASEAVAAAQAALQHGFGDNRLRAANTLALALDAAGDRPAALALVEATLLEATRPADGTDVRTFRYLSALEATQALLGDRPPEAP